MFQDVLDGICGSINHLGQGSTLVFLEATEHVAHHAATIRTATLGSDAHLHAREGIRAEVANDGLHPIVATGRACRPEP